MTPSPLTRIRKLCLALPGAHEVEAWDAPTFRLKNKLFAMYVARDNSHHPGVPGVWIKCDPVSQGFLLQANPRRYFKPPYVGPSGWIGVRLDGRVSWKDVGDLLRAGYDMTAHRTSPKKKAR